MTRRVILVGDPKLGLTLMADELELEYSVRRIAFIDQENISEGDINSNWEVIDFRNFHELTIRIMEIEPDVLIYLSPFIRVNWCARYPDYAEIANSEAVAHLHESLSIHNTHLILISVIDKDQINQTPGYRKRQQTFRDGEEIVAGMNKCSIIRVPELVTQSSDGLLAWFKEFQPEINPEVVTVGFLTHAIRERINTRQFGISEVVETELDNLSFEPINNQHFEGSFQDYAYLLED